MFYKSLWINFKLHISSSNFMVAKLKSGSFIFMGISLVDIDKCRIPFLYFWSKTLPKFSVTQNGTQLTKTSRSHWSVKAHWGCDLQCKDFRWSHLSSLMFICQSFVWWSDDVKAGVQVCFSLCPDSCVGSWGSPRQPEPHLCMGPSQRKMPCYHHLPYGVGAESGFLQGRSLLSLCWSVAEAENSHFFAPRQETGWKTAVNQLMGIKALQPFFPL